jgi:hypothetical protein
MIQSLSKLKTIIYESAIMILLKQHQRILIILIVVILGLFLRTYQFQSYPFGFDQVQILENSEKIISRDLTLIGPRTGYAQMFTGPLIYYLNAILLWFSHSIYSVVFASVFISLITGTSLYFISRRYFNPETSLVTLFLWAVSPYIVELDRIPWNPNLTLIAGICALFPLFAKKLYKIDYLLLFIGSLLSYQAHFSGIFILFLTIFISIIFHKKSVLKIIPISLSGFLLSIASIVVFDFRNNWLNLNGLVELLTANQHRTSIFVFTKGLVKSLYITVENIGKVIFLKTNEALIFITGLVSIYLATWIYLKEKQRTLAISISWITIIAFAYAFYSGPKPEYYYLLQLPAISVLLATIITHIISNSKHLFIIMTLFALYSLIMAFATYQAPRGLEIGNIVNVQNYINTYSQSIPISEIILDIDLGNKPGLVYALKDTTLTPNGQKLHIAYPSNVPFSGTIKFGNVSIWLDPRESGQHVTEGAFILTYPPPVKIYKSSSSDLSFGLNDSYVVMSNGQHKGNLYVLDDKNAPDHYEILLKKCQGIEGCSKKWVNLYIENLDQQFSIFQIRDKLFLYKNLTSEPIDTSKIAIY